MVVDQCKLSILKKKKKKKMKGKKSQTGQGSNP